MVYLTKMRLWGALILLAFALSHLPYITAEPVDHHSWRQVTTAGVARAFYYESSDIFHPRIFDRENRPGITGMEFPLYNYLIYIVIEIFGYANWYGRAISLVFGIAGLYWFWRFVSLLLGETIGLLGLLSLAVSPLYFYFSRNIQPDIPMLALLIGSFYYIRRWQLDGRSRHLWLCCALFALASLLKLPAIIFFPYHLSVIWEKQGRGAFKKLTNYFFALIPAAVVSGWYAYSAYLVNAYGLRYFYLGGDLSESLSYLFKWKFYNVAFVSRLPEIVSNFALFPLAVAGIFLLRKLRVSYSVIILLLLLIPYYAVGGFHLYIHDYYSLPVTPMLALLAGAAAFYILRHGGRWLKVTVIALLAIAPLAGISRASVWYKSVFPDFPRAETMVREYVPPQAAMVSAWRVDPTLLFFTERNGWSMPPENIDLTKLYRQGARYLITTSEMDKRIPGHDLLMPVANDASLRLYSILESDTNSFRAPAGRGD